MLFWVVWFIFIWVTIQYISHLSCPFLTFYIHIKKKDFYFGRTSSDRDTTGLRKCLLTGHTENEPSFNLSAPDTKGQRSHHAEWSVSQIRMPTRLAVFISNSQSHKIIGCVGQQLWCHFLNCRHTSLNALSCLSPNLGFSSPPWAPCEPLLDKTHYPSLLLFRKLIIPSITSGLSDNRMNMPSHRLIRSLCLEFVGEQNRSPHLYISCNYLSNMISLVSHCILLLVIINSCLQYTFISSDSNIDSLFDSQGVRWAYFSPKPSSDWGRVLWLFSFVLAGYSASFIGSTA